MINQTHAYAANTGAATAEIEADAASSPLVSAINYRFGWAQTTLTYAFERPGVLADKGGSTGGSTRTSAWNNVEEAKVHDAFAHISDITNLRFSEVGLTATANLDFQKVEEVAGNFAGFAYLPNPSSSSSRVVIGTPYIDSASNTVIHEIGHLLGLSHTHSRGSFPGVVNYWDPGTNGLNNELYSTMSYRAAADATRPSLTIDSKGTHFMAIDIAALQLKYGANMGHATGNDTYGRIDHLEAIWDAGGTDAIDFSGESNSVVIDLRAATLKSEPGGGGHLSFVYADGSDSRAQRTEGGYTIAYGAIIEMGFGGSGNDRLTGNEAANYLSGGAGSDILLGGGGADWLFGGLGDDTLYAGDGEHGSSGTGTGVDYLSGQDGNDQYYFHRSDGNAYIGSYGESADTGFRDTVIFRDLDFRDVSLVSYNHGGSEGVALYLTWNDGTTYSQFGMANFGAHVEVLVFGDTVVSSEFVFGDAAGGLLSGTESNDVLFGLSANDWIFAGAGNDILDAGGGNGGVELLAGQSGDDIYRYAQEDGQVYVGSYGEDASSGNWDRVFFEDLAITDITLANYDFAANTSHANEGVALFFQWDNGAASGSMGFANMASAIEAFEFDNDITVNEIVFAGQAGGATFAPNSYDWVIGLDGDDALYGQGGNDVLDAGGTAGGVQYLSGGLGNDTYLYSKQNGEVFVSHNGEQAITTPGNQDDRIIFKDLAVADITVSTFDFTTIASTFSEGTGLFVNWNDGANSGRIGIGNSGIAIEYYEFADGNILTYGDLLLMA